MKLNIIGLGRLAKALSRLFLAKGLVEVQAIYSTTRSNVLDFISEIHQGEICHDLCEIPRANLTLITSPDDHIQHLARMLATNTNIQSGDVFVHCSGLLLSDVLYPLQEKGGLVASAHPLRSFTRQTGKDYTGTYCAIEGEEKAVSFLHDFFSSIGFIPVTIHADKKPLYHAGAVFASNYLVTLFDQAMRCIEGAGIAHEMAKHIVQSLMQGTLNNLKHHEPASALTGPLMRGDIETIGAHLASLHESTRLYQELAKATLPLTEHSEETLVELKKLLSLSSFL